MFFPLKQFFSRQKSKVFTAYFGSCAAARKACVSGSY